MHAIDVLPSVRLLRAADAVISHQFTDTDGEPGAPPAGVLTVVVTKASTGTTVTTGAVAGTGTAARTATIAGTEILHTDWLTATWSLDGDFLAVDTIEVVGGTLGTAAELRATDPTLNGKSAAELHEKRRLVEDMSLAVLGRSVFERFYIERLDGMGHGGLVLSYPDLVEVVWVNEWSGTTATPWAEAVLVQSNPDGIAVHSSVWPYGRQNIEIAYRFGMRSCPQDLLIALRKSVRHAFTAFDTGVPTYAASMQTADGFNFGLVGPGNENWATGDRDVDRVINRYKVARVGVL